MSVDQSDEEEDLEGKLINYLQTILKYQIEPMYFMNLRKLVKEAPKQLKIYNYIQEKYPGEEFLTFLRKHHPDTFYVNPDRTVQVREASYCLQPQPKSSQQNNVSYDEVDGDDNAEYISDQESNESDRMSDSDSETSK